MPEPRPTPPPTPPPSPTTRSTTRSMRTPTPLRAGRSLLSRAPLWVRLVAGSLLLVALSLLVTGFVGTRLLHGYHLQRIDDQLEVVNRVQGPYVNRFQGEVPPGVPPRRD